MTELLSKRNSCLKICNTYQEEKTSSMGSLLHKNSVGIRQLSNLQNILEWELSLYSIWKVQLS